MVKAVQQGSFGDCELDTSRRSKKSKLELPEPSEHAYNLTLRFDSRDVDADEARERLGKLRGQGYEIPANFRKGVMDDVKLLSLYHRVVDYIACFAGRFRPQYSKD